MFLQQSNQSQSILNVPTSGLVVGFAIAVITLLVIGHGLISSNVRRRPKLQPQVPPPTTKTTLLRRTAIATTVCIIGSVLLYLIAIYFSLVGSEKPKPWLDKQRSQWVIILIASGVFIICLH